MKVGLITIHNTVSYGASLQTYATCRVLTDMGHQVSIIDYSLQAQNIDMLHKAADKFRKTVYDFLTGFKRIKKERRFGKFRAAYFPPMTRRYDSKAELDADAPDFDVYICGSDQIWNPNHTMYDSAYFLSFAEKKGKTIMSYASSIGEDSLGQKGKAFLVDNLNRFDYISVREDSAKRLLEEELGCHSIEQNADPTLLLTRDEWLSVAEQNYKLPQKYILFFPMAVNPVGEKIATELKHKIGLPVVALSGASKKIPFVDIQIADAGQADFISLIANADTVVTNSFHGAAFSLNFKKQLIMYKHPSRNTRLESLTRLFKCKKLLAQSIEDFRNTDWNTEWSNTASGIDVILERERKRSKDYFIRSIGNVK